MYPAVSPRVMRFAAGATVIDRVIATTFHRFMGNGRTSPALFSCASRDPEFTRDYVVKLRGGLELGGRGLAFELYASMLSGYFGMSCPRPAIVSVEQDLATLILDQLDREDPKTRVIQGSVGLNFGSQFLVNLTAWPTDKSATGPLQQAAMRVYAFDALIQNPDRRFANPNLGSRGDDLFIYDHESAFSFLLDIFPSRTPWRLDEERYLEGHVFARALRQVAFPPDFLQRLDVLTTEVTGYFTSQIPTEWKSDGLSRIELHLALMSEHAAEFAEEIARRLA
jgi:hypothetical protein